MMKRSYIGSLLFAFALIILSCKEKPSSKAVQATNNQQTSINSIDQALLDGQKLYNQHCMSCHLINGAGLKGVNPPLFNTDWVTGDKERLIKLTLKGMNEKIEVDGISYSIPMVGFEYLSDNQIAAILTYIRSSWGNDASAITPEEVSALR